MRAGRLTDPTHPAFGQCGLFASKKLGAGVRVLDYCGVVSLTEHESKESDYTLAFVEGGDFPLTLDAALKGNEARFINDFRGTGRKANVRFAARVDASGERCMGVFTLREVAKHEELLLSYGKGFWMARGLLGRGEEGKEADALAERLGAAL
jgi:SET domain-containing protein